MTDRRTTPTTPDETATAARLLAAWWSRPTTDEQARWAAGWQDAAQAAGALSRPLVSVDALRRAVEDVPQASLSEEYERLFVGPGRSPCPPYESLWRTDATRRERGRLMGAAAGDAERLYRDLGLQLRHDAHELPDHLVVECEALAYASETGATAVAHSLVHEHLAQWLPAFCAAVAAETSVPYYTALAALTAGWIQALAT